MTDHFRDIIVKLFDRDLDKLAVEISLYDDKSSIWKITGDIKNPAGNLCLHLCGNLQHYIGKVLGGTDYKRNRDYEFSARAISKETLLAEVRETKSTVHHTLANIEENTLASPYPEKVFDYDMNTDYFLVHLQGHLNYHLGQINYHRRLITT
ncbi:DinB family protein [Chryseosolibacter indicus]|uniref:DUF1572 family protein n=1 Tax=Chryseosolibacter indicus TaxID=2782351 RepID=A0ABS5VPD5_9BACT|nr:DinB family protein [Chryseosolibacter indicus]MBT1703288.1 DUF1572 family protein [Chryseosolibacter indicus]